MAINPSNSNAISVKSLPSAQLVVNGDNLIVDTPNGTQIIDFKNLNVVKTDILGNATVNGDLSGVNALFGTGNFTSLSAYGIVTTGGVGISDSNNFYDRFTIQNGLILSANSNPYSNPIYRTITTTILPQLTSNLVNQNGRKRIVDANGSFTFNAKQTLSDVITVPSFFSLYPTLQVTSFQTNPGAYFIVMPEQPSIPSNGYNALVTLGTYLGDYAGAGVDGPLVMQALTGLIASVPTLTATPVVASVPGNTVYQDNTDLKFQIKLASPLAASAKVFYRVLVTY
jgi:hypothetical protein